MDYLLRVAGACNMDCSYCFRDKSDKQVMSLDTAIRFLSYASKNDDDPGVWFMGGEPLLCKDLIKSIVNLGPAFGVNRFGLTTNGLLLDDEFLKFAAEKKIEISISFDGTEKAHNKNRRTLSGEPTYDLVFAAVKRLLAAQPKARVIAVITDETIHDIVEISEAIQSLGAGKLCLGLDITGANPPPHICDYPKVLTISPRGEIFPCAALFNKRYSIGDIFKGINQKKFSTFKRIGH